MSRRSRQQRSNAQSNGINPENERGNRGNSDTTKQDEINAANLISTISTRCSYLTYLMTTPDRIDDLLLEELWEEKINDRLLKYPHIPGAKLFNKLSAECWNEVYMQKEEKNEQEEKGKVGQQQFLMEEIKKISSEIRQIEVKSNMNFSI